MAVVVGVAAGAPYNGVVHAARMDTPKTCAKKGSGVGSPDSEGPPPPHSHETAADDFAILSNTRDAMAS